MSNVIDHKWQQWAAESYINGATIEELVEALNDSGFLSEDITKLVTDLTRHPYIQAGFKVATEQKKLEWLLYIYEQLNEAKNLPLTIERRANLSFEEFEQLYYRGNKPIILTDIIKTDLNSEIWTEPYLKKQFGQLTVEIQNLKKAQGQQKNFSDFIEFIENNPVANELYMTAFNCQANKTLITALAQHIWLNEDFFNVEQKEEKGLLWYGPGGTCGTLHIDLYNGFLFQVKGRKSVKMVPSYYYPYIDDSYGLFSQINLDKLDLKQFPAFELAKVLEFTLEPGETLFIPVGWWHQVKALDVSISFTFLNTKLENDFLPFEALYPEYSDYFRHAIQVNENKTARTIIKTEEANIEKTFGS